MRKALPVFIAVCLALSLCAGVFASVPEVKAAGPAAVNLGTADHFAILAETGITTTGTTHVTGDIGISSYAASFITGFALVAPPTTFTTSALVTGNVYAADYDPPTPINMGIAVGDMYTAYTNAAGVTAPAPLTELGAGDISGLTLAPGVYKWSTGVLINTNVTLSGGANDVWIFQIAGDLNIASAGDVTSGIKVVLAGGAQASNVFWQVGGLTGATLGTYSTFNGTILSAKQIIMQTGAVLNGRALAQTQVTLDSATVSIPVQAAPPEPRPTPAPPAPTPPPTPTPKPTPAPTTVYHQTFFIGYPDGTFKPDRNVSRAEVAAALTRALGLGWSNTAPSYPDVPATHWAAGDIQIMKAEGIMIGDTSGTFRPDAPITRAEAAAALLRMLKIAPIQNLPFSAFPDVPVTYWAAGYISAMQMKGYITGYPDGTYKPTVNILRSEFTAIADRTLGREIGASSQVTGLAGGVVWPDVPTTQWAYLYILEASTPHTVTNAVKLDRTIVLTSKTIPLFSDGASTVTIHKARDVLTAIVPVDGLLPNGSVPAARTVTVAITNELKP